MRELFGDRVELHSLRRDVLEVTAFERRATSASTSRRATARRSSPAPTRAQTGARRSSTPRSTGSATSWNLGTTERARFELEYLLAVGTRA